MAELRRRNPKEIPDRGQSIAPPEPAERVEPEPIQLKVTAVLIACDQEAALRRSIAALEASEDRERLEILQVDCGSRDGSPRLDADYPSLGMLRLPHNFGATRAVNIATRTAKGEFLFLLAPGVEVEPGTVSKLAALLDADETLTAVCPLLVDENGSLVSRIRKIPTRASLGAACKGEAHELIRIDTAAESVDVEYPGRRALMVRKKFIQGMNYLDDHYGEFWSDADLAMQIRRGGKKIRLYPGIRATDRAPEEQGKLTGLLAADRVIGAARFLGKYDGFFSGLTFRLAATLKALIRFDFSQFAALVSGQKLDGTQSG